MGWSRAFAASLRGAVVDSDILGFIAEKTINERNCAKVWTTIKSALSSDSNIRLSQVCQRWLEFFDIGCDNVSEFPKFYNNYRKTTMKLSNLNQLAMTDDMFLKFFIFFKVKVDQFSEVRKKHLTDHSTSSDALLESLLDEFKTLKEEDAIDGNTPGTTTSRGVPGLLSRRNMAREYGQRDGGGIKKRKAAPLTLMNLGSVRTL